MALMLSACATMQERFEAPKVTITSLSLDRVTLLEQRYRMGLRIQNPNDMALSIAGMAYRFNVNGRELASGVSDQPARASIVPGRRGAMSSSACSMRCSSASCGR